MRVVLNSNNMEGLGMYLLSPLLLAALAAGHLGRESYTARYSDFMMSETDLPYAGGYNMGPYGAQRQAAPSG